MILEGLVTGMFQSNCYIVGCETTRQAMIVDPGDEGERILRVIERLQLQTQVIVCTHTHIDHVAALAGVHEATGAAVAMHREAFESSHGQSAITRLLIGRDADPLPEPDVLLEDGDKVSVGELEFEVLSAPAMPTGTSASTDRGLYSPATPCLGGDRPLRPARRRRQAPADGHPGQAPHPA